MKKVFTFILSIMLCFSVFAASESLSLIKRKELRANKIAQFRPKQLKTAQLRSSSSLPMRMDSAIQNGVEFKNTYAFNTQGQLTQEDSYVKDANNLWILQTSELHEYNTKGLQTSFSTSSRNPLDETWSNNQKFEYTYDTKDSLSSSSLHGWNITNNSWEKQAELVYAYDTNGNLISMTHSVDNSGTWTADERYAFTYDGNNREISDIYSYWNGADWENLEKYEYSYDTNGNETLEMYYEWDTAWELKSRIMKSYDSNNNLTKEESSDYTTDINNNPIWEISDVTEYAYDSNNNMVSEIYSYSGILINKTIKGYDSYNNLLTVETYSHDGTNWIASQRVNYNFDTDFSLYSMLVPPSIKSLGTSMLLDYSIDSYDSNSDSWLSSIEVIYYYSDGTTTKMLDGKINNVSVIQKQDAIYVDGFEGEALFEILNTQGKTLTRISIKREESISTRQLPDGIYLLKINTGKNIFVKKIAVK